MKLTFVFLAFFTFFVIEIPLYAKSAKPQILAIPSSVVSPAATSMVGRSGGYNPSDLRMLYRVDRQPYFGNSSTVCLVEAGDQSSMHADAIVYANAFHLPQPDISFIPVPQGVSPYPDWNIEAALDIEMVMAIAPLAKIIVIEAVDAEIYDMEDAVRLAPSLNCDVVSMSFASPAGQIDAKQTKSLYEVSGIAFFASTGDQTGEGAYPALQPGVVGVGGTTVHLQGPLSSQTVWNDGPNSGEGAGLSSVFFTPSYQNGFNPNPYKQVPEVAAIADPETGVAIHAGGKWWVAGGTSASTPIWAALTALVYEARRANSLPVIPDIHQVIYGVLAQLYSSSFVDIVSGCIGSLCATKGYDRVSGFGTPQADAIISTLGQKNVEAPNADIPVPADYSGIGHVEPGVFRPTNGFWFMINPNGSQSGAAFGSGTNFSALADIPVPANFDGKGAADLAVFRPTTAQWFIQHHDGSQTIESFGSSTGDKSGADVPVPADYDGVGKAELAVFRPSTGQWIIAKPNGSLRTVSFGEKETTFQHADVPVPADYDGVGHAEIAVFRPSTGQWFILNPNGSQRVVSFGAPEGVLQHWDIPVPGDYDQVGHAELAVFRPSTATWYIQQPNGNQRAVAYGASGVVLRRE